MKMNRIEPFLDVKFELINTVGLLQGELQLHVRGHTVEAGQVVPRLQPQPQSGEADIGAISLEAGQLVRGQLRGQRLGEAALGGGGHVVPPEIAVT